MWLIDEISNRATHNTSSRAAKELTHQQYLIPTDAHEHGLHVSRHHRRIHIHVKARSRREVLRTRAIATQHFTKGLELHQLQYQLLFMQNQLCNREPQCIQCLMIQHQTVGQSTCSMLTAFHALYHPTPQ